MSLALLLVLAGLPATKNAGPSSPGEALNYCAHDNGTAAAPAIGWCSAGTTAGKEGWYREAGSPDALVCSTDGVERLRVSSSAVTSSVQVLAPNGSATSGGYCFSVGGNECVFRSGDEIHFSINGVDTAAISANTLSVRTFNSTAGSGEVALGCASVGCRYHGGNAARYLEDNGSQFPTVRGSGINLTHTAGTSNGLLYNGNGRVYFDSGAAGITYVSGNVASGSGLVGVVITSGQDITSGDYIAVFSDASNQRLRVTDTGSIMPVTNLGPTLGGPSNRFLSAAIGTLDLDTVLAQSEGGTGAGVLACSAGQVLTSNGTTYSCTAGGVSSLAAVGGSPNANGATISGSTLNLEPASTSHPGVVTTGAQSFAGAKTFTAGFAAGASGTVVVDSRHCSLTVNFDNMAASAEDTQTVACAGVTTDSAVACHITTTPEANLMSPWIWVSSAGNISFRTRNLNAVASIDPNSATYECRFWDK